MLTSEQTADFFHKSSLPPHVPRTVDEVIALAHRRMAEWQREADEAVRLNSTASASVSMTTSITISANSYATTAPSMCFLNRAEKRAAERASRRANQRQFDTRPKRR